MGTAKGDVEVGFGDRGGRDRPREGAEFAAGLVGAGFALAGGRLVADDGREMSRDAFEILGVERRPVLDAAVIQRAYRERARCLHPDSSGGDAGAFLELTGAYETVRGVGSRLRALAGGAGRETTVTDADLFLRVGDVLRKGLDLVRRVDEARQPLARALLAREVARHGAGLDLVRTAVELRMEGVEIELRDLDGRWPDISEAELALLAGRFDRLTRWSRQVDEQKLRLRG